MEQKSLETLPYKPKPLKTLRIGGRSREWGPLLEEGAGEEDGSC